MSNETVSISKCARCGQDHDSVPMHRFWRQPELYTHWAMCPTNGEPILIRVCCERNSERCDFDDDDY